MPQSTLPPQVSGEIPGPQSRALAARLHKVESRNITAPAKRSAPAPVFWRRARGANVWDADGNRFVDLCAGFGAALLGHAHPKVVRAISTQAQTVLHGMGDVQPAEIKVALLEELCARFPGGKPARAVLGLSGADAVECALKTALLATGRAGVIAFEGGYHGLNFGALDAAWRADFKAPFAARLPGATAFARYGEAQSVLSAAQNCAQPVGAVLMEPVQGRGGMRVPPPGFLRELRELCDTNNWLLIADEIFTGMGRTGKLFACEHENIAPDLMCIGKGLAGGMPLSACLGRAEVMDAWPPSTGEALHTQTFLGHPPGCAAALAVLSQLEQHNLPRRAAQLGAAALSQLQQGCAGAAVAEVRGRGLMLGIEFASGALAKRVCNRALARGIITLPCGDGGRVLSLTPPLTIESDALQNALEIVMQTVREL